MLLNIPVGKAAAIRATAILFLSVLLFVFAVAYLRGFAPEAAGFDQKGPLLLLYHLSRLVIALSIPVACYSVGYLVLGLWRVDPRERFETARSAFILCFFLGASLYGIAFTLLGLVGLIGLPSGLALTIPVLLLSRHPLKSLLEGSLTAVTCHVSSDRNAGPAFAWFVVLVAVGTVGMFLAVRMLYVAVFDPNIWEHYLHYYRAVLASGSTQPNEVWHHFYASKGAGLIFLANVLSDFLGVQLVSACFVLVAAVIILDLLLEYCSSVTWALLGVVLFLAFLYGHVADGAAFKHHAVILGYMSFAFWGSIRIPRATATQHGPLLAVMAISLVYFGFYQPAILALLTPAIVLFVLIRAAQGEKTHLHSYAILASALVAGGALVFWTNWILTGVPEITPMRLIWEFADRAKFKTVFGTGGVEYFLGMNNNLAADYDWSLNRVWNVLQYPLPPKIAFFGFLCMLIALIRKRTRGNVSHAAGILLPIVAFVLPLGLFAQAMQTAAVDRVALYSIVMTTVACVVIFKSLGDVFFSSGAWVSIPARITISGRKILDTRHEIGPRRVATMAIITMGMLLALTSAWRAIGNKKPIYGYISGAMSLKDSMRAAEVISSKAKNGLAIGIDVSEMTTLRKTLVSSERVLRLTYDSGFSYSIPGVGFVSEPTYALIRDRQAMLESTPDKVADYLREQKIGYFIVNLQGNMFSTIAFAALFDVREMPKYFSIAYENGDIFILKWRRGADETPLSRYFLTLFELKQTGLLNFPFSTRFAKYVLKGELGFVDRAAGFRKVRNEFLQDVDRAFASEILLYVTLQTSKAALFRILDAGKRAVALEDPGALDSEILDSRMSAMELKDPNGSNSEEKVSALRRRLVPEYRGVEGQLLTPVWESDLRERFLERFREAIFEAEEAEVGSGLAELSRKCDERVPFARKYPASASC